MSAAQIIAIVIFLTMFVMIVLDKIERQIVTLVSGLFVIVLVFGICMHSTEAIMNTLNVHTIFTTGFWYGESEGVSVGINWATIIFIAGMMIMVEGLGNAGVFRWLCLWIAKKVNYHTVPLLICFGTISALLAMFIDSITVILFLAAVTVELAKTLKFDPVPMILTEIFCANLGGSATMCGDPPNIIIGTSLKLTFFDFLSNTGAIAGICFIFAIIYFYLCFRKELKASEALRDPAIVYPSPADAITNKKAFIANIVVFLFIVCLLVTHAQTELSVAFIGVIAAVCTLAVTRITTDKKQTTAIIRNLDYKTLLFFVGLFIVVGGLEETNILKLIAAFIDKMSGGNIYLMVAIVIWVSAIASAFIDNIPFAATMVPVIRDMAAAMPGVDLNLLAWTLALGADLGGNGTPIGASANVVGTSIAAKNGHSITWGRYCKYCAPATIMVTLVSMLCIYARYLG